MGGGDGLLFVVSLVGTRRGGGGSVCAGAANAREWALLGLYTGLLASSRSRNWAAAASALWHSSNLGLPLGPWYWGTGGILFREYCFGGENSLSSAAKLVWVLRETRWVRVYHTHNRLKGTHPNSASPKKLTELGVWNRTPRNRIRAVSEIWGVQNVWGGGKRTRRTRSPENFWIPPKELLFCSVVDFCTGKTEHWHLRGGKRTARGGVQNPFLGGVSFVRFSSPLFFSTPPWRLLNHFQEPRVEIRTACYRIENGEIQKNSWGGGRVLRKFGGAGGDVLAKVLLPHSFPRKDPLASTPGPASTPSCRSTFPSTLPSNFLDFPFLYSVAGRLDLKPRVHSLASLAAWEDIDFGPLARSSRKMA